MSSSFHLLARSSIRDLSLIHIVITNTIPLPPEKRIEKIKCLSIAPLIGEAIIRIHEDISVSKLFV